MKKVLFAACAVLLAMLLWQSASAFKGMGAGPIQATAPSLEGIVKVGPTVGSGQVWLYDSSANPVYKLSGNQYLYCANGNGLATGSSTTDASASVDLYFTRSTTNQWKITSDNSSEWADLKLRSVTSVATLGSEVAPALTAGNWTVGAGWESPIVGPGLIKNADGTGTQTTSAATSIVAGTTYKVVITLSAASVGSASYTLGGVTGANSLAAVTTYTDYITASTTGKIIITPTNTSRFTISAISYKAMTGGGPIGSTTNDRAVAGVTGEYFQSLVPVGSAITLTTSNTVYDITSLVLTAGSWSVSGNINLGAVTGTITAEVAGFNTTSATIPTDGSEVNSGILTTAVSDTDGITLPPKVFLLSTSTTVYMSAKVTKAAGTITGYGQMTAIRFR